MTQTTPPPPPAEPIGHLDDVCARACAAVDELARLAARSWADEPGQVCLDMLDQVEQATRRIEALRVQLLSAVEADGLWALDGSRTLTAWLRENTGAAAGTCSRWVRTARTIRNHLPSAAAALTRGSIGVDHALILAREATRTRAQREHLADPNLGEAYLVEQAELLDAQALTTLVKTWAMRADPEAADRAYREADAEEEVFLAPTMDGYHLEGWLSEMNGRLLDRALSAHMGRKTAGDDRTPAGRRADALASLAHESLDSGAHGSSARVRPHLTVTVPWETFQALTAATGSAIPPDHGRGTNCFGGGRDEVVSPPFSGDDAFHAARGHADHRDRDDLADHGGAHRVRDWVENWQPGDDHVISTAIDHQHLVDMEPATFSDGTPLPPLMLARLACESQLARVVFGPESTVLDAGREKRIFPANQARAIIARDRHCRFPGCHEPPEFGEIHHSLWWWQHQGSTSVEQGILLCWHHHNLVHTREITITRHRGAWLFTTRDGMPIVAPRHSQRADGHPRREAA